MSMDLEFLRSWVGKQMVAHDQVTPFPLQALSATLDRDETWREGEAIPPLWHWLYCLPLHRLSDSGPDGHALRGGFLPPVALPRRMWAGSQIQFHAPLRVGQVIEKVSTIDDIQLKTGRQGELVFVKVRHEISGDGQRLIDEFHDIVYRRPAAPGGPAPVGHAPPEAALWSRTVVADDVLLFRYSALTFNGHRIHYDRRYVTEVEGYPGLVVHGPLMATLLMDLLREHEPRAQVQTFQFRALQPVFDGAPFQICGRPGEAGEVALWVLTPQGQLAMDASVRLGAW